MATDHPGLPDPLAIEPLARPFEVTVTPPGSKSMTCRAYLLAALGNGESVVERPLRSDDTDGLLRALGRLGVEHAWDGDALRVRGVGGRFPRGGAVDLGDGGTPARFMLAAACLADAPVVVDGSPRMRERPIAELVELLVRLGARIEFLGADGQLPVRVDGASVVGGGLDVPTTASSQYVSALLLIAPGLPGGLELRHTGAITSEPYVALTERMMRAWGLEVSATGEGPRRHRVEAAAFPAGRCAIEADASSAVYWWTAALLVPGATARVRGVGADSPQPDARFLDLVDPAGEDGARIERGASEIAVTGGRSRRPVGGGRISAAGAPDGAMAMAAYAAMVNAPAASGGLASRIDGLHTLKVKETDRLTALATELGRLGCTVSATDDSITVDPSTRHDRPAVIRTYRDHRMAMAFAVLGRARPGISIVDPGCVSKSYPGFWEDFARLEGSTRAR